jgi:hypothetical protein
MSTAAAVERIFDDGLNPEIRGVLWERLQHISTTAPGFSDVERGYARQLAGVFDAVDLGGDVSREVKKLTNGALGWATILLEELIGVERERSRE